MREENSRANKHIQLMYSVSIRTAENEHSPWSSFDGHSVPLSQGSHSDFPIVVDYLLELEIASKTCKKNKQPKFPEKTWLLRNCR